MTTASESKPIKILLLRSYSKAPFSIKAAMAINKCDGVQFMQYPLWPTHHSYQNEIYKFHKMGLDENVLNEINKNAITSYNDLQKRLENHYFDFCIVIDHDATLFELHDAGVLCRIKSSSGYYLRSLLSRSEKLSQAYNYKHSLPLSLAQLSDLIPIIGVDFSDSVFLTERNKMILENSFLFFKRELPFDRFLLYAQNRPSPWSSRREEILARVNNIVGIPLGVEDEKYFELKSQRVERERKEIDIFISGEITNTLRSRALDYIKKFVKDRSLNVVIKKTVPFQEYCDLTAKSKITISIAGSRWECFRHYEAIALGSLPLMNKPTIDATWWHDMPDEIFFENTFDNFTSRLEKLLIDDELRRRCSAYVEKRIENHMLHSKILDYIISTTTEKIRNDGWGVQLNKENPGAFG